MSPFSWVFICTVKRFAYLVWVIWHVSCRWFVLCVHRFRFCGGFLFSVESISSPQVYLPQSSAKPLARSSAMTCAERSFKLARIMIGTVG